MRVDFKETRAKKKSKSVWRGLLGKGWTGAVLTGLTAVFLQAKAQPIAGPSPTPPTANSCEYQPLEGGCRSNPRLRNCLNTMAGQNPHWDKCQRLPRGSGSGYFPGDDPGHFLRLFVGGEEKTGFFDQKGNWLGPFTPYSRPPGASYMVITFFNPICADPPETCENASTYQLYFRVMPVIPVGTREISQLKERNNLGLPIVVTKDQLNKAWFPAP